VNTSFPFWGGVNNADAESECRLGHEHSGMLPSHLNTNLKINETIDVKNTGSTHDIFSLPQKLL
jgi:hypothetical protein